MVRAGAAVIDPDMEAVLRWQNKKIKGTQVPGATKLLYQSYTVYAQTFVGDKSKRLSNVNHICSIWPFLLQPEPVS